MRGVSDSAVLEVRWLNLVACCQRCCFFITKFLGQIAVLQIRREPDHLLPIISVLGSTYNTFR